MTLISMLLFDLVPSASPRRFAEWLSAELANHEACAAAADQTFLGLYETAIDLYPGTRPQTVSLGGRCAMLHLAQAPSVEHALQREVPAAGAAPPAFHSGRQAWIAPASMQRLWLAPMCHSSFAAAPMRLDGKLLHVAMRYLPQPRTVDELIAFNQRIVQPYAEAMTVARWFHVGSLHVVGLPEYLYADAFDVVEAATIAEALANDDKVPVTPAYRAIQNECVEYLDQARERFALWLLPLVVGTAASSQGVRFA
jgi:hypothetical protein